MVFLSVVIIVLLFMIKSLIRSIFRNGGDLSDYLLLVMYNAMIITNIILLFAKYSTVA